MSNNSALEEMGVKNPKEITRYTLRSEGSQDVLKIYYRRQKGSFLPSSRKYKFGRSTNTVRVDSGKREFEETSPISPFLQKAIAELDSIVKHQDKSTDHKKTLIAEIEHLEETMHNKLAELRRLAEELD